MRGLKWIALGLILFFSLSCIYLKMVKIFTGENVERTGYKEKIDCQYQGRLIFVNVTINGSDEPFRFILDTGAALCVISEQIATRYEIKSSVKDQISDATGKKGTIGFGKIPSLTIGGIPFKNIGTAIMNVDRTPVLKCYRIDGVIGANLMRLVPVWQIDYKNQKVLMSDDISFGPPGPKDLIIPFKKNSQRIPEITLRINHDLSLKCKIDLGSTHGIVSILGEWQKIKAPNPGIVYVTGYGEGTQGALGKAQGMVVTAKIENSCLGQAPVPPCLMTFYPTGYTSIGNDLLDNYILTLNWQKQQIILSPLSTGFGKDTLSGFGFSYSYNFEKRGIYVSFIYKNSPAEREGFKIGDQIITMNGKKLENISPDEYCQLIFPKDSLLETDILEVEIKQPELTKKVTLYREILIK